MGAQDQYLTAIFKAEADEPYVDPHDNISTAGIDVNTWGSRIEVHGEDNYRADLLRRFVLDAIHAKQQRRTIQPRCVITGCALFLNGTWVAADLFDAGEFWLVNANVRVTEGGSIGVEWLDPNIVRTSYSKHVLIIDLDPFWERRGVFLIHKSCAVLNQAALDYLKLAAI